MRILVVVNAESISDALHARLALSGAAVECVASCADADVALATSRFNAVVLDLMQPNGSAFELLRTMRDRCDQTPVILRAHLGKFLPVWLPR